MSKVHEFTDGRRVLRYRELPSSTSNALHWCAEGHDAGGSKVEFLLGEGRQTKADALRLARKFFQGTEKVIPLAPEPPREP